MANALTFEEVGVHAPSFVNNSTRDEFSSSGPAGRVAAGIHPKQPTEGNIFGWLTGKVPDYFLRGFLARSFGAPRALLTTLLPVPIAPAGAACSIAAWM
jgi:hypothetical protein